MLAELPKGLTVGGRYYRIRTDYRACLDIMAAFNDSELSVQEQWEVLLEILYYKALDIPEEHLTEAMEKAVWFLNCGEKTTAPTSNKRLYDWEQDEQMIFSAINKVSGREVRSVNYMHWWTFIALFNEIGEGMFSTVVSIRSKKNKGKKLENYEKEFCQNNRDIVDLQRQYSTEEQQEIDKINRLLRG